MKAYLKDPDAELDFAVDWTAWIAAGGTGEAITSVVWTVPDGITEGDKEWTPTIATIWLSGGTHGVNYIVGCRIVTELGRTDERSFVVQVRNR